MKRNLTALFCIFFNFCLQSQTRFGIAEFNKKEVPAVIGEIPYQQDITKDGLQKYFEKLGYKSKKAKDYFLYNGISLPQLGSQPLDLYFMVDRKSRQDKGTSVITLLVSTGFENFINDSTNPDLIAASRIYLTNLREVVAEYDLDLQIENQEDVIKKAEKKFINLQEDGMDLEKKKKKIEEEIAKNIVDIAQQKVEKERQKQILDNLKSKRKTTSQ
jgi:hypothetical protein